MDERYYSHFGLSLMRILPTSQSSPINNDTEHNYWYRRGVLRSRNMRMLDTVELKLCIW